MWLDRFGSWNLKKFLCKIVRYVKKEDKILFFYGDNYGKIIFFVRLKRKVWSKRKMICGFSCEIVLLLCDYCFRVYCFIVWGIIVGVLMKCLFWLMKGYLKLI